jgi:hypothetical protein
MSRMKELLGDTPYELYGGVPPHQKHSATSEAAAVSVQQRIGPLHKKILNYLEQNPVGATDEQLMEQLDMGGNTLRPRRRELQLMGRIGDSGKTRLTRSGRNAVVWRIAAMAG